MLQHFENLLRIITAMARQESENFPPSNHDLDLSHYEVAKEPVQITSSRNMKEILPKFDAVLQACLAVLFVSQYMRGDREW